MYPALLPLMRTPPLPVVDWTDAPADFNGLVRFAERRNLVAVRVPPLFNWPLPAWQSCGIPILCSLVCRYQYFLRMCCLHLSGYVSTLTMEAAGSYACWYQSTNYIAPHSICLRLLLILEYIFDHVFHFYLTM